MRISVTRARRASWPLALLVVGLVAGACSAGVSSSSVAPAAPGASTAAGGAATSSTPAPASTAPGASAASAGPATVSTASAGGLGPFLAGAGGRTLYILTRDHPGTSTCTGACASVWPPFTAGGGASAVAGSGVTGTLGTITRPDGSTQVTYDGMPLYYYSGDTQAGQANGQGVQGIWYVALAAGNTAAPASAAPSASGYSGY